MLLMFVKSKTEIPKPPGCNPAVLSISYIVLSAHNVSFSPLVQDVVVFASVDTIC